MKSKSEKGRIIGIYYYLVAGGIVGGIALYLQRKKFVKLLKGKKIAVLGERGVGKTTLVHFQAKIRFPKI